jgi:2-polyprenyl-3-methyl-5-hydroxy-6-metoxy-1,4-benzoquinol methylase
MAKLESVIKHFSGVAKTYNARSLSFPWSWIRSAEWHAISALISDVVGLRMLDLGCGAGLFSRQFRDRGVAEVYAVDACSEMTANLEREKNIIVLSTSIENLEIDTRFDLIIAAGLVEFLESPDTVFKVARTHAKPDAILLLLFPYDGILTRLYKLFHFYNGLEINIVSENILLSLAKQSDWNIISMRRASPISVAASFSFAG